LPVAFIIYCIAMVGETNRAPFDLPEAEGELVGGFHTEYSSLKFALFFLAEYVNLITVSAIATTLFLGGWRVPFGIERVWPGANVGWWPVLWFMAKLLAFIFLFIWLRGTLPRLRYDQFMRFGWKVLIPAGLLWIVAVSFIRTYRNDPDLSFTARLLLIGGLAVIIVIAVSAYWAASSKDLEAAEARRIVAPPEIDPFEGGYPVPPMPGQAIRRTAGPVLTAQVAAVAARSEQVVAQDDEEVRGG
jgi:NADH-quinone oxidoreductase subunit H